VVGFQIVGGLSDLGVGAAFYISVAAALGFVIPVPGGIGAYHYLVSKALEVIGYSPELGTAFATIIHSGQSLMFIATGAIGMVYLYIARKK
jgi:glycosyltransferase 2 family protein